MTVHRSQGATVGRTHALEDGGGRELAYVKMSRAKDRSTVYVVADTVAQAKEDLARDWSAERRPTWAIDSGTPTTDPAAVEASIRVAKPMRAALRRGRLVAERQAVAAAIPPDPTAEIQTVERQRDRLKRQRRDLMAGTGVYADQPVGQAVREVEHAEKNLTRLESDLRNFKPGRGERRHARAETRQWEQRLSTAAHDRDALTGPELGRLDQIDDRLADRLSGLWAQRHDRQEWIDRHPEAARRLDHLGTEIDGRDARTDQGRALDERTASLDPDHPWIRMARAAERDLGLDLGR